MDLLQASPELIEFGMLRELRVCEEDSKSPREDLKFLELMGSEKLCIFNVRLFEEGDCVLESGSSFEQLSLAVDLINLLKFEILLLF